MDGNISEIGTCVKRTMAGSTVNAGIIRAKFDLRAWKNCCMSFMRSMSIVAPTNIDSSIVTLVGLLMSRPAPKYVPAAGHKS